MALTKKQETFCQEVIKQDSYSAAYRIAYNASNMTSKQINEEASILMSTPKISQRVEELTKKVEQKMLYTIGQSVKRDLNLIERYEAALDVLENKESTENEIETAERTIKYIGSNGYNSAQERLSKQHGFYEKDNTQKTIPINILNIDPFDGPDKENDGIKED